MVKPTLEEDGQGDEGRSTCPGDQEGGRRKLANVKFYPPDHTPEGGDLRLDGNDFGIDAFDRNRSVPDRGGMWVLGYGDRQAKAGWQLNIVHAMPLTLEHQLLPGCAGHMGVSTTIEWTDSAVRLALTVLAGTIIGGNRSERGSAAGLGTTILVCLALSLAMIHTNVLLGTQGKLGDSLLQFDLMRLPFGILTRVGSWQPASFSGAAEP